MQVIAFGADLTAKGQPKPAYSGVAPDGISVFRSYRGRHSSAEDDSCASALFLGGFCPFEAMPFQSYAGQGFPIGSIELASSLATHQQYMLNEAVG
jgi:hypothetical protein